jgi:hypothetical protein
VLFYLPLPQESFVLRCAILIENSTVHPARSHRCTDLDSEECAPPLPRIWIVWEAEATRSCAEAMQAAVAECGGCAGNARRGRGCHHVGQWFSASGGVVEVRV